MCYALWTSGPSPEIVRVANPRWVPPFKADALSSSTPSCPVASELTLWSQICWTLFTIHKSRSLTFLVRLPSLWASRKEVGASIYSKKTAPSSLTISWLQGHNQKMDVPLSTDPVRIPWRNKLVVMAHVSLTLTCAGSWESQITGDLSVPRRMKERKEWIPGSTYTMQYHISKKK